VSVYFVFQAKTKFRVSWFGILINQARLAEVSPGRYPRVLGCRTGTQECWGWLDSTGNHDICQNSVQKRKAQNKNLEPMLKRKQKWAGCECQGTLGYTGINVCQKDSHFEWTTEAHGWRNLVTPEFPDNSHPALLLLLSIAPRFLFWDFPFFCTEFCIYHWLPVLSSQPQHSWVLSCRPSYPWVPAWAWPQQPAGLLGFQNQETRKLCLAWNNKINTHYELRDFFLGQKNV